MKRIIYLILLIIWMGVIFYFSNQNSISSTNQSDKVINGGVIKVIKIFDKDMSQREESSLYLKLITPIRKHAHIVEFFILGLLTFLFINTYEFSINMKLFYSLAFCFLYGVSDELHQLFIEGRSGSIGDVLIDFLGSILSILICFIYIKIKKKKIIYNKSKIL